MPTGLDEHDGPTRHEAGEERGAIPVPDLLALGLAVCVLTVLEGVVYDPKVSAATRRRRANASSEVLVFALRDLMMVMTAVMAAALAAEVFGRDAK